jgi:plastocyanin
VTHIEILNVFHKNSISFLIFIISSLFVLGINISATTSVLATQDQNKPDINAANVYQTRTIILGNNIKNLIILIPDEAHESMNQVKSQLPLINQPYVPQNAIVNVGTTVTWFHADVDHKHTITLNDKSSGNNVFTTKPFLFNTATEPFTFNKTGSFEYFEKNVNKQDPKFVMEGTITVVNQNSSLSNANNKQTSNINTNTPTTTGTNTSSTTTAGNADTVGTYMVPAKDLDKDTSELKKGGLSVDSTFTYKDARGGQKGTGPEQALVVWTSAGMDLDKVIAVLKQITPTLPYS